MAERTTTQRRLIADRLVAVRAALPTTGDDGPTIGELIERRHPDRADRDRVRGWFEAADAPDGSAVLVCCPRHALRRAYEWAKHDDNLTDLDHIEQGHQCAPPAAS